MLILKEVYNGCAAPPPPLHCVFVLGRNDGVVTATPETWPPETWPFVYTAVQQYLYLGSAVCRTPHWLGSGSYITGLYKNRVKHQRNTVDVEP